jgi:hypothetical protein
MNIKHLEKLRNRYLELSKEVIDFNKFNHIGIVHHSTVIEGSLFSSIETEVLLSESLTPKGKPLEHA